MDQNTKITAQIDPETYPFRYTIDFHLKVYAARYSRELKEVKRELLAKLNALGIGMSERMLDRYRIEPTDSERAELSAERLEVMAGYFGISTEEIKTDQLRQMRRA